MLREGVARVYRLVSPRLRIPEFLRFSQTRLGQGSIELYQDGFNGKAAGYLGEAALRLFGVAVNVKSLPKAPATAGRTIPEIDQWCFSPETLVATSDGQKQINQVETGEFVLAFDFETNSWVESEVQQRHDSEFSGELITVSICDSNIIVTEQHPFWVVEGRLLNERSRPGHLADGEDEGKLLPGRWVNSNDLEVGDVVIGRDGTTHLITDLTRTEVKNYQVCNLTVKGHHTFAVGNQALLVHNISWCDVLSKQVKKPKALVDFAERNGFTSSQVHAHHIVQKYFDPKQAGNRSSKHWYIQQSQKILEKYHVPLLDIAEDANKLAKEGKKLHNLTWAINGNGTHAKPTVIEVYNRLSKARSKESVEEILGELSAEFMMGNLVGVH